MRSNFTTKFFLFASMIAIITIFVPPKVTSITHADANVVPHFYAQIQREQIHLLGSNFEQIFEIPYSYYVELLEDEVNGYYKARYLDQTGYVKASDIQCVSNEPSVPFLNYVNFRVFTSQSCQLRTEPTNVHGINSLITQVELYETNFRYYGTIYGQELISGRGNIWYYCSYTTNNATEFGYIYAGGTDQLTTFTPNSLSTFPISKHQWVKPILDDNVQNNTILGKVELPSMSQIAIILAISIPLFIILALLIYKPRVVKSPHSSSVITMPPPSSRMASAKKSRGRDYYELE